ncbi:MAG: hypothetical protein ACTTKL_10630 [Treponema sp.]
MKGSVTVTPSTGSDTNVQGKNDVYLENGKMITINDTLSPTGGTAARITPSTYATTTQVLAGSNVGTEHEKFTVTPQGSQNWKVGSDGKLQMN